MAAVQHGLVASYQLVETGLHERTIARRIESGHLHPIHRGVYAVGHPHLTRHGRWMAAVLAGGEGALLSHVSAAQLWGLTRGRQLPIHVTVTRNGGRKDRGLRFHHPRSLHEDDRSIRDRIPVTSVARTLLDLAGTPKIASAFEEAHRIELLDVRALEQLLTRTRGRRGLKTLAALLAEHARPPDDTKPGIETEFAAYCRARLIPVPSFNAYVEDYQVDALWPAEKLVAELDSRGFHSTWEARERDYVRDADLQEWGYDVIRVTARRMRHDGDRLEATIRRLLAMPRAAAAAG